MNKHFRYCCLIFALLVAQNELKAQSQSSVKKGTVFALAGTITLDSLTHYVHKLSGIRFSFNSSKVKGNKTIHFPANRYHLDALLAHVKHTTSLYYSFFNGYVVFQDNPPLQKNSVVKNVLKQNAVQAKPLVKKSSMVKKELVKHNAIIPQNNTESILPVSIVSIEKKPEEKISIVEPAIQPADSAVFPALQNQPPLTDSIKRYQLSLAFKRDSAKRSFALGIIDTTEKQKMPKEIKSKKRVSLRHFGGSTSYSSNNNQNGRGLDLNYGLEWKLPLPVQGTNYFSTGANGKSQPYVFLLPGIFIGKTFDKKNTVWLEVQLLQHFYSKEQLLKDTFEKISPLDTSVIHTRINAIKTYGYTLGLHYQHLYNDKWFVGCGLSYHIQNKVLMHYQKNIVATDVSIQDSLGVIKGGDLGSIGISKAFISLNPEIGLQFRKTQIGMQGAVPVFTSVFKNMHVYPLAIQLFFRWQWNERPTW